MGWSNWGVSGYAGLEILSDGWLSDSDAGLRERWDGLIADRTGCAGMGSSDAHSAGDIGQERTYVYTGGSTSKTAILAGIRNGQTVVSDGIFASCDIKGRGIGEHVRASFGESLPVRVDWPTSQNLSTVTLVYNGRTVREHVHADDNAASGLVIPVTATDGGAIRIEATGTNGKHAYTSPVFVDVGVAGGVIDLVFVVDTTGSMWDDIAAAKQAATQIAASLEGVDARVAVVDYRDFPQWPYGTSWDYPYHDVLDFTSDQAAIATGIRSLYLGNGLDWQESVYSALMHTIDGTSLGGWRQQPNKYIILIGDAPPHDPEPFTGYEMQDVLDAAYAADPITIYPIVVGGESTTVWYFNGLAEGSGGRTFTANNAGELVDAILAAIGDIIETPAVSAELRVEPRTLNLESEGQGISAHLSFPHELPAGGITVTELKVNGVVLPVTGDAPLVDGDSNGVADVRVTFDRAALEAILDPGEQTLLVTGKVNGRLFSASDIIKVTDPVHDTGGNLRN